MPEIKDVVAANPGCKILGRTKFALLMKKEGFKRAEALKYYDSREINQVIKKPMAAKVAQRTMFKINARPYSFQIDLAMMPQYESSNNGKVSFLLIIEILSRKAFAYALRNSTMAQVLESYQKFVTKDSGHTVLQVAGDDFFSNKAFTDFNKEHKIQVTTSVAKNDHIKGSGFGDRVGIIMGPRHQDPESASEQADARGGKHKVGDTS